VILLIQQFGMHHYIEKLTVLIFILWTI